MRHLGAKMLLDETLYASQLNVNDKDDKNYPMNRQKSPLSSYDPSDYCTTREAAKILGTSLRTIQLWVESGILQAWKTPGGHRRITRESMQQLFERRTSTFAKTRQARLKILVAEDDEDLLKLYEMTLSGWDLPLDLALVRNGFDALIKIGEAKPDVLITDLNMSGMDGFQMIRALRDEDYYRSMKIVVVTGLGKSEIKARGGLPKDVSVFFKPVAFEELRTTVLDLLG